MQTHYQWKSWLKSWFLLDIHMLCCQNIIASQCSTPWHDVGFHRSFTPVFPPGICDGINRVWAEALGGSVCLWSFICDSYCIAQGARFIHCPRVTWAESGAFKIWPTVTDINVHPSKPLDLFFFLLSSFGEKANFGWAHHEKNQQTKKSVYYTHIPSTVALDICVSIKYLLLEPWIQELKQRIT